MGLSNKFLILATGLFVSSCVSTTPSQPQNTNLKDFEILGTEYRTKNAPSIEMLQIGTVERNGGTNYLQPKSLLKAKDIELVRRIETYSKSTSDRSTQGGLVVGPADISGKNVTKITDNGAYEVWEVRVQDSVTQALNDEANAELLERLKRRGKQSIVTGIVFVADYQFARNAKKESNFKLDQITPKHNEIPVPVNGTISDVKSYVVNQKISDGTVIAYQYSRICWHKVAGKVVVADIDVDIKGDLDNNCPKGTETDPKKL